MYERAVELEMAQRPADALQAFVACNAKADIVRLLEREGYNLLERGNMDRVAAAIALFTKEEAKLPSALANLMGTIEAQRGRTDISDAWFREAQASASTNALLADVAFQHATALVTRHQAESAARLLTPWIEDSQLELSQRCRLMSLLAVAYIMRRRFADAVRLSDKAIKLLDENSTPDIRAEVYHHAAWVALFAGDIKGAKLLAPQAAKLAMEESLYDIASRAYSVLYNISNDVEDDPESSERHLRLIEECGMRSQKKQLQLYALLGLYDLASENAELETMRSLAARIDEHEVSYSDPMISEAFLPARALQLACSGEFAEAHDLLAPSVVSEDADDRRAFRFSELAIYAAAAALRGGAEQNINNAMRLLASLEQGSRRVQKTVLYLAIACLLDGRQQQAESLIASLQGATRLTTRIRALHDAVAALSLYWSGSPNHDQLFRALERLRERRLGGVAQLIEALPHPRVLELA